MAIVRSRIPARLDRLPWSRWHWTVVIGLGITWVLDGLEVTIVGSIGSRLQDRAALGLSATEVGESATSYLVGAVIGALVFGYLTDRLGRKKLFLVTLTWYLAATVLTAFSWNVESFLAFRFLTGLGIGGEYSAINATIDELIPSARRGWVDLAINGTYWLGAILGSGASIVLLDPRLADQAYGWRIAFGLGAVLAVGILFVREGLPESPRWLLAHGRADEAERVVAAIEARVERDVGRALPEARGEIAIDAAARHGIGASVRTMVRTYPRRTAVALALMVAQAFLYNAIFFTESLVLTTFFRVPPQSVGYYIFPFAVGNLLGPLVLGRLFDSVGRKPMIALTYALSAAMLLATGEAFVHGLLDARTIAVCWSLTFFVASAAASAAYLTASETFPLEVRGSAIAVVYAVGTLVGGAIGPTLFGALIATRRPEALLAGYAIATGAMLAAAGVELVFGVEAAGRSLEDVAAPLATVA